MGIQMFSVAEARPSTMVRVGGGQSYNTCGRRWTFFNFDCYQLEPSWTVAPLQLKTFGNLIFTGLDTTSGTVASPRLDFYREHHQTRTVSATENGWTFNLYGIRHDILGHLGTYFYPTCSRRWLRSWTYQLEIRSIIALNTLASSSPDLLKGPAWLFALALIRIGFNLSLRLPPDKS